MLTLRARYRTAAEFLDHLQPSLAEGGIFYPTREALDVGTPVVVEIAFPGLADHHALRASVAFRRPGRLRPERQRAGLGLEFHVSERRKRDYLIAAARGVGTGDARRRHRRLPVELAVGWFVPGEDARRPARTRDIGAGGAFLITDRTLAVGAPIVVEVAAPGGALPSAVEGRVAWICDAPGERGLGVQFRCRDTGGIHRLKELVRRLAEETPAASA